MADQIVVLRDGVRRAGRLADRALRASRQPVRRRLPRRAADEHPARQRSAAATPSASTLDGGVHCRCPAATSLSPMARRSRSASAPSMPRSAAARSRSPSTPPRCSARRPSSTPDRAPASPSPSPAAASAAPAPATASRSPCPNAFVHLFDAYGPRHRRPRGLARSLPDLAALFRRNRPALPQHVSARTAVASSPSTASIAFTCIPAVKASRPAKLSSSWRPSGYRNSFSPEPARLHASVASSRNAPEETGHPPQAGGGQHRIRYDW